MGIVDLIEKALDVRAFYQRILATNIANVETPGYKEKEVDFKTELARLTKGRPGNIGVSEKSAEEGAASIDGNTVDIENQIVKMTENTLMFNSLVQMINKKFYMIRYAINEGRK
ncbi:MAG: flagellar basal body rod protein FlgB [Syntrophorhabdales bacterium]|jgi:flagellar basal-body rod protein FlgB